MEFHGNSNQRGKIKLGVLCLPIPTPPPSDPPLGPPKAPKIMV